MTSKRFVLLIAALLAGSSLPAWAQGGGGGDAGGDGGLGPERLRSRSRREREAYWEFGLRPRIS
jgi:hypothetical protein